MAAADYLDDDEFDDYNPHPYSGGYDISATYGSPLPHSPATCYPVSTPAAVPAPTAPQPSSLPQPPAPAPPRQSPPAQPRSSSPPQSPPPVAEPYYWPEPYNYGDAPRDQPMYAAPEVFRGWPYFSGAQCHSTCGRDYWRHCMRGLDYLFGHSDGYGERRIGVDYHGIPVYANKKGGVEDAVVVEVAPPATGTVECHDAGEKQYESNPNYTSYDRPYEQSYSLHGASDEPTWFPNQSYQEVYKEEDSQYQEFLSYDADNKISSQPIFSYNQHLSEQQLHIHVEPPETASSYKLEYYENFSTYADQNDADNLESSRLSYEIQPYVHIPYDQLEPYRPSWPLNLGYYQACTERVSPEYDDRTQASGECWDMSSLFLSPFYPQETQIYEQSHGDEIV
ncbi:uncharacterized protein At5g39570-like isoform X2 [Phragmites australis]|uniref:uncharacterized protein At5g39570-like isoform X2 n=1 Tax=Phragmites australis TaxID=29695 RepID=UPI002D79BD3C|nr:uncharacterized protein At5g39570-like isoform X2 [Phragmites australis]